jgi:hypothetical protein
MRAKVLAFRSSGAGILKSIASGLETLPKSISEPFITARPAFIEARFFREANYTVCSKREEHHMKYTGGCHCGKVRFEVDMSIEKLMSCNCSICSKRGHLLTFTGEKNFKLLSGQDSLNDYQHGKKRIHFLFCKSCGIAAFSRGQAPDGSATVAINARCLDGLNPKDFTISEFDGKSL